jgi:hypothetical protein
MNKALTAAIVAAALTFGASAAMAADDTKMAPDPKATTDTGPGAGTPPGQPADSETSDRTPDKATTTPESQATTKDGETSDRTPDKDATKK